MHLNPKKRIEVFSDTKIIVMRDDTKNQSIHMLALVTKIEQREQF